MDCEVVFHSEGWWLQKQKMSCRMVCVITNL